MAGDHIIVLNAGSSSVKFAVFRASDTGRPRPVFRGAVTDVGGSEAALAVRDVSTDARVEPAQAHGPIDDHSAALRAVLALVGDQLGGERLLAAGHRIVHGGPDFQAPCRIDADVFAALERLQPLAPLHQPHNLAGVRALWEVHPELPQVACFDTAFHADQRETARVVPLPRAFRERGIRRYGFHGLSYDYVTQTFSETAGRPLPERTVIAHLGNGASLAAVQDGRSVATTMGFSTLDGMPMGTRCGSLDPGIVLHLLRHEGLSLDRLERLLYEESGMLGLSGVSADMRTLLDDHSLAARLAVDTYVHRAARSVADMAAAMEGLDGLVFTGGIGENADPIRRAICDKLGWLGVHIDPEANARHSRDLAAASSRIGIWAVPTDEEQVIAAHAAAFAT